MANLKNTTITDTGNLQFTSGTTASRPNIQSTVIAFTTTGTTSWTAPTGVTQVEVLVVAGGGQGGFGYGGGGGAGGLIYNPAYTVVSGNSYTVTVGAGGSSGANNATTVGANGSNSVFDALTAVGGGGGASQTTYPNTGGSGGGGGYQLPLSGVAYPLNPGASVSVTGQGFAGGAGHNYTIGAASGGGGGAGEMGGPCGWNDPGPAGSGGNGLYFAQFSSYGVSGWFAGGGGGGSGNNPTDYAGVGGLGGGGAGNSASSGAGTAGTANTGGGGGGGGPSGLGGAGGSGIVLIRYATVTLSGTAISPQGATYFNSDHRQLETYNGTALGWTGQDPTRNFAGHNLLVNSQAFTSTGWTANNGVFATTSATTAPDGTNTAFTFSETATTNTFYFLQGINVTANVPVTHSVYIKANGRTRVHLGFSNYSNWVGGNGVETIFDIGNLLVSPISPSTPVASSITAVGNGWYRISLTGMPTVTMGSNWFMFLDPYSSGNIADDAAYAGVANTGVYVWGAQSEQGVTSPGPYVRTGSTSSPIPTSIGGYRTHTYTTVGTSGFTPACTGNVEVLVVAGGGSGGGENSSGSPGGAGGGAGGVIYSANYGVIANQQYTVVVGAGGAVPSGVNVQGNNGGYSQFGALISVGGGAGGGSYFGTSGSAAPYLSAGYAGGSGGGGGVSSGMGTVPNAGGYVFGQGNAGGYGTQGAGNDTGGGGGGAISMGQHGVQNTFPGNGGNGLLSNISGTPTYYGGGGGGGQQNGTPVGYGGLGGGAQQNTSATANTGGGGGGPAYTGFTYTAGGSGIVIVRYRYD